MSIIRLSREILQCDYLIERLREEADPDVAEIFRLQEKKDRLAARRAQLQAQAPPPVAPQDGCEMYGASAQGQ